MQLIDEVILSVQQNPRYQSIAPELVRRVATQEFAKGRGFKETVKAVRNKLHQVGGAYQEKPIDYPRLLAELQTLPPDPHHPALREFCQRAMSLHASTLERLPILERFYAETLASLGPIHSILDLACGLNPLTLPWLPLSPHAQLSACDIYLDQLAFLNQFYQHLNISGHAFACDLAAGAPPQPVQLALLLKTIPCLEQVDKSAGERLLSTIQAEHILVSFPAKSLGGRSKGMLQNYEARFRQLITGLSWQVQRFEFSTELAFLVTK